MMADYFFPIQIIHHYERSEKGRRIEQCTEENNFQRGYVYSKES